jgi:transposase
MNCTQNEKLLQITPETLVVGVDIGSEYHFARAIDFRGYEYSKGAYKFSNDGNGFKAFDNWVADLMKQQGKTKVIVGMEPTGHYWYGLGNHLEDTGISLGMVNPFHVKRTKELDDNSPTKNDRKDPKTIAMLVKDGRYQVPYMPTGAYRELRNAMELRRQCVTQMVAIQNRVKRWLVIYFPEFNTVFKKWTGKAALMTLRNFPTPQAVLEAGQEKIVTVWKQEIKRAVGRKHAQRLVKAAENSIGLPHGQGTARLEMELLLEEYENCSRRYRRIMDLVEKHLQDIPYAEKLLGIKGIGIVAVAGFIAAVGDITRFKAPEQVIKLLGLNIRENSSGKHKGKTTITKRGRADGRYAIFQAVLPLVAKNAEFREIHYYYTHREERPLKKIQSIVAICCKLIRIFYAILKTGRDYDAVKMLNDIKRPMREAA